MVPSRPPSSAKRHHPKHRQTRDRNGDRKRQSVRAGKRSRKLRPARRRAWSRRNSGAVRLRHGAQHVRVVSPFRWSLRWPATPRGLSIFWPQDRCCWSAFASAGSRASPPRRDRSTLTPRTRCRRSSASPPHGDCCSLISPPAPRWPAERSTTPPFSPSSFFTGRLPPFPRSPWSAPSPDGSPIATSSSPLK